MRALLSFSIIYVVIGMLSNISSLRIVEVLGISMDAGTLLYPLTFTLRDLIHKNFIMLLDGGVEINKALYIATRNAIDKEVGDFKDEL